MGWRKRTSCALQTFKPAVCVLEDRTVPSSFRTFQPPPGPATHFQVIVPQNVKVGTPFAVTVQALDASNRTAAGYVGTVHFTLSSGDNPPADYAFRPIDFGVHKFQFTLTAGGGQTINVADSKKPTIVGNASTTVNPVPVTTHLSVIVSPHVATGASTTVTVVAIDASNQVVPTYAGTVSLTSTDLAATMPANHKFVAADHGKYVFHVTFKTAQQTTVTATDTVVASITGSANLTADTIGVATHFAVYTVSRAFAGNAIAVTVIALDGFDQWVPNYRGTVHFASSDLFADLPDDYPFQPFDNGRHTFLVFFGATGKQTLSVTDLGDPAITGSVSVRIGMPWWYWAW